MERILVIDDEVAKCEMIAGSLQAGGYDCRCIAAPSAVIEVLEKDGFDLVIFDQLLERRIGL